jgi:NAD(P)-dependent dehydrogenase (short-subunit alcohol dehydrogenase family)
MESARAAIITGSSRGIGLEAAKELVRRGCIVYGISRSAPGFSHELFTHIPGDVSDPASVRTSSQAALDGIKEKGARLQALVNNAGYAQVGAVEDVPLEMVRRQFETNVFGLLEMTRCILPAMKERHSGRIVNVSSVVGHFSGPYGGIYSATKHSVEALSAAMRMELKKHGIKVVVVNPGLTATGFHKEAFGTLSGFMEKSEHSGWYSSYMEKHMGGAPPSVAAAAIAAAVLDASPRRCYVLGGKEGMVLMLRKALPEGAFYSLVEKRAGL